MTDHINDNHSSNPGQTGQQSQDSESSARGRAYGLSGVDETEETEGREGDLASGSAAGDVSRNQQVADDGLASDAMGSGSGSDLMHGYDIDKDSGDDTDIAKVGDNIGVTGGR